MCNGVLTMILVTVVTITAVETPGVVVNTPSLVHLWTGPACHTLLSDPRTLTGHLGHHTTSLQRGNHLFYICGPCFLLFPMVMYINGDFDGVNSMYSTPK